MKTSLRELVKEWDETAKVHKEMASKLRAKNGTPENILLVTTMSQIYQECAESLRELL